jgi:HK97 family phage major capsid protein
MPATSKTFQRMRITQQTAVDKQSAEKAELVNQPMKISLEDVAKDTYGGWVNVSRQVLDWTTPGALEEIIYSLTANLLAKAEARASADLVKTATEKIEADLTDPAGLNAAIYQAAAKVYGANTSKHTPADRVWMSPDTWAAIGAMVDGDKRPLFPALNPQNALGALRPNDPTGGDFGGLRVVVSGGLPAKTLIVGASEAVEVYEDQRGTLQAIEPSVLGTQVAAYAYLASYAAQPKELVTLAQKAPGGGGTK